MTVRIAFFKDFQYECPHFADSELKHAVVVSLIGVFNQKSLHPIGWYRTVRSWLHQSQHLAHLSKQVDVKSHHYGYKGGAEMLIL